MTRGYLPALVAVLFLLLCPAVVQAGTWVERSDVPCSGGYGEAVVGTGTVSMLRDVCMPHVIHRSRATIRILIVGHQ